MKQLLRILVSPVAWLACFSAVYALHGLVCELDPGTWDPVAGWPRIVLVLAFVAAVLLQIGPLALLFSARFGAAPGFVRSVSLASGWVGLVATVWTLIPTLATTPCG